jgi:hypothetical protein
MSNVKLTTEPAHLIAHKIQQAISAGYTIEKMKVAVQPYGTLRIIARSVAAASIELTRACNCLGITRDAIAEYEVRFWGTNGVATYPTTVDPTRQGIDSRTGAIIAKSDMAFLHDHWLNG